MNTLTVFILSYNRPKLLKKSINSILGQTIFESIDLQVYDNNSSFDISQALIEFDHESISIVQHSSNLGSTGNFKAAFFAPKYTKYFCIFHDDDLMDPRYCALAIEYLDLHQETSWVASQHRTFHENSILYTDTRNVPCPFQDYSSSDLSRNLIYSNIDFSFCSVIYRSSLLSDIDREEFNRLSTRYSIVMDRPLLFDLLSIGSKCAITQSKMIDSYIHPGQDSKTGPLQFENIVSLLDKYIKLASQSTSRKSYDKLLYKTWVSFNTISGYKHITGSQLNKTGFNEYKISQIFGINSIHELHRYNTLHAIFLFFAKIKKVFIKLHLLLIR